MTGDGPAGLSTTGRAGPRRAAGHDARAAPCSTRRTSTPTSGTSPASFAPDRACAGASTTAPARCGWSATGRRCGWRTGCPAATSTRTWRSPAWSPARCTASSNELELEPAFTGNAYDDATRAAGADARCATRWRCGRSAASPAARVRRRGRRPLRQQRPGRAGRLRRRGHRLGAVPGVRATVSHARRRASTRRPRRSSRRVPPTTRGGDRRRDRARRGGRSSRGAASRRATGPGCCAASPPWSTRTSRSWPSSRCATPATPSATPAGRPATSATCSTTTRPRRSG